MDLVRAVISKIVLNRWSENNILISHYHSQTQSLFCIWNSMLKCKWLVSVGWKCDDGAMFCYAPKFLIHLVVARDITWLIPGSGFFPPPSPDHPHQVLFSVGWGVCLFLVRRQGGAGEGSHDERVMRIGVMTYLQSTSRSFFVTLFLSSKSHLIKKGKNIVVSLSFSIIDYKR